MADVDLAKLVAEQQGTLGEMARSLAAGDGAKVADGATALVGALVTGHPEVALLAPFAETAYAKAFGNSANAMLRRELAALEEDEKRRAFVGQIGEAIEALIGQALVQLVREGATGVRVRVGAAAQRVFINRQVVSGKGSVGIDLT